MRVNVDIQQVFSSGGHDFNLDVAFACDEDITVIFGQSGAGKSLLLKIIAGLKSAKSGKIVVNDFTFSILKKGLPSIPRTETLVICFRTTHFFHIKLYLRILVFLKHVFLEANLTSRTLNGYTNYLKYFKFKTLKKSFLQRYLVDKDNV